MEDLSGRRHFGPNWVDHRSRRRSSIVFFDSCVVLNVVFWVLTCLVMNLLDLGR